MTGESPDPHPRTPPEIQRYRAAAKRAGIDLPPRPTAFPLIVTAVTQDLAGVRITAVAAGLSDDYAERFLIRGTPRASLPAEGDVVYRARNLLSFFDMESMTPVIFDIRRLPNGR